MPKYKYSLAPRIKEFVELELEKHCQTVRELESYKEDLMPSVTVTLGESSGGSSGKISDSTADVAIRLTTDAHVSWVERSTAAINRVLSHCDSVDEKLIELKYYKRTHTIEGAAMAIPVGKSTAYDRINKILYMIAVELGIINY